jgi:hypothetical protein
MGWLHGTSANHDMLAAVLGDQHWVVQHFDLQLAAMAGWVNRLGLKLQSCCLHVEGSP